MQDKDDDAQKQRFSNKPFCEAPPEGSKSPKLPRKFDKVNNPVARSTLTSTNFLADFSKTVEYICRSLITRGKNHSFKDVHVEPDEVERHCHFIKEIATSRETKALLQLHRVLSEYRLKESSAATQDLQKLMHTTSCLIREISLGQSQECNELLRLLQGAHMQALCWTHDIIAGRKYEPQLEEVLGVSPTDSLSDSYTDGGGGGAMKIVRLIKNAEPLGATIKKTDEGIVVARVIVGGVADRSGCIHAGDRIVEVNGQLVADLEPNEIVRLLDATESGSVTFRLIPNPISESPVLSHSHKEHAFGALADNSLSDEVSIASMAAGAGDPLFGDRRLYVRAQFTYKPSEDTISPCPEAGLPFKVGEVLEILNQDDRHWWQARNVAETATLKVGLIPSATLEERKQMIRSVSAHSHRATTASPTPSTPVSARASASGPDSSLDRRIMRRSKSGLAGRLSKPAILPPVHYHHTPVSNRRFATGFGGTNVTSGYQTSHHKAPFRMFDVRECDNLESTDCRTYEEVRLLYPLPHQYRPIVLVGAPGVGRNELKRRLLLADPERYATTVPHTSRKQRPGETDGVDYHFATKLTMETWIRQGFFIEYGEYKGNLYGTVIDSIHQIVDAGQVCVVNPHPQALRLLRNAELKPYIVFIRPPPFPALKESRCGSQARSTFAKDYSRGFTDEELQQMILNSERLARNYEHWFDYSIVNGDLDTAFHELLDVLHGVQNDPQWVPAQWAAQ